VRFFSNDPAFVYTFTHAFNKNDLLIKDLMSRVSKSALKIPAEARNKDNQIGYVKSFYFAYLIMENKSLFAKIRLDAMSVPYSRTKLLSDVADQDSKVQERNEAKPKKQRKLNTPKEQELPDEDESPPSNLTPRTKTTKGVSRTPMAKRTSTVKNVKRAKRI
jgi:hypothetical protein